jgi:hypothetical protein
MTHSVLLFPFLGTLSTPVPTLDIERSRPKTPPLSSHGRNSG